MSKQPPPAPTASAVGPCPTIIQIVGRPGTGSLSSTIAPPDHPLSRWDPRYSPTLLHRLQTPLTQPTLLFSFMAPRASGMILPLVDSYRRPGSKPWLESKTATVWSSRNAVANRSPRPRCSPCLMGQNTLSSRSG